MSMRCTLMRCTLVRYTPMRHTLPGMAAKAMPSCHYRISARTRIFSLNDYARIFA
jgi:hypothetical protein